MSAGLTRRASRRQIAESLIGQRGRGSGQLPEFRAYHRLSVSYYLGNSSEQASHVWKDQYRRAALW